MHLCTSAVNHNDQMTHTLNPYQMQIGLTPSIYFQASNVITLNLLTDPRSVGPLTTADPIVPVHGDASAAATS